MLPIQSALPELLAALASLNAAVLIASPGAGKTTGVPPALLAAGWRGDSRILVVEPRRLAARAAAARIAEVMGEPLGRTVGYRVRNDTRVSKKTRIELITAGVFIRMILDDPALAGVAAVLFDEAHERAMEADLGLALALDAQAGLREDLRILAMSATLDGRRFSELLHGAPIVESEGRLHPVETIYLGADPAIRLEDRVAAAVLKGLAEEAGSVLAFLPGQAEILRTAQRLGSRVPDRVVVAPLYGALDLSAQDRAIRPAPVGGRKVVLATSIAETSLTIEGVRLVVDGGFSRRPRFQPGSGLTRLETVRVSRAAADQRRGRAGRVEPGLCYRLWDAPQTASLVPYDRPEILDTDLSALALTLLTWGVAEPERLRWLDPPPAPAYREALELLDRLGARNPAGGLSAHGRRLAELPLSPRLAHMLLAGAQAGEAQLAAEIAALLSEPGLGGRDTDIRHRLESFRRERGGRAKAACEAASRWAKLAQSGEPANGSDLSPGAFLALAFPERLAQARGARGRFRMANGVGAKLDEADPLADEPFLAIGELGGGGPDARIVVAAPLIRAGIERLFAGRIVTKEDLTYDSAADRLRAFRTTRLDALVLSRVTLDAHLDEQAANILAEAAAVAALPWPADVRSLRERIGLLRRTDPTWADLSDAALTESVAEWLPQGLFGKRGLGELTPGDLRNALAPLFPWTRIGELDRLAPAEFEAPSGRVLAIDYSSGEPVVRVAVQNLFGLQDHPAVRGGATPITFELLSPAGRALQVTRDLPGFWRGSWRDVRAEMRGRYPKHVWPEDPENADPRAGARRRQ